LLPNPRFLSINTEPALPIASQSKFFPGKSQRKILSRILRMILQSSKNDEIVDWMILKKINGFEMLKMHR
jgi:hypothetical protein